MTVAFEKRATPSAGAFERIAWMMGSALLCVYLGAQMRLWVDRESALDAFQAQKTRARAHLRELDAEGARSSSERVAGTVDPLRSSGPPDTREWSAGRIAAFAAASHDPSAPAALLRIDAVDIEVPIYEGVSEWNLNRGAAWIEDTAAVGADGNVGLAAHRDGYFRALKDVRVGDSIQIETAEARLDYRIVDLRIVSPQAIEVLAPTPYDALTLVTCYPFYYVGAAPQRFIVRAERTWRREPSLRAASRPFLSGELADERQGAAQRHQP